VSQTDIDIEEVFADFVEDFGGIVSDRASTRGNKPANADYIFHEDKIVAEMKLLKEDPFKNKDWNKSFEKKKRQWLDSGRITLLELQRITQVNQLPANLYRDIIKLYGRPIKYQIERANKQIKATKETLNLNDYKGLVLIGSDGNYFLQPRHVRYFIASILDNELIYKSINTVIYFTANVVTTRPGDPTFTRLWINLYRDKEHFQNVPLSFLKRLYEGWVDFYKSVTGIDLAVLSEMNAEGISENDQLEQTNFLLLPTEDS
jgi:hypothetical protein